VFQFVAVCTTWWLCFTSCCVSVCRCLYKLVVVLHFMLCFILSLSVQTGCCASLHAVFHFVAVCTNWLLCFTSRCVSVCRCLYKLVVVFHFMLCFRLSLSVQTGGFVSLHAVFQFVTVCTNWWLCFTSCCVSVCRCLYKHGFYDEWSLASLKLTTDDVINTETER